MYCDPVSCICLTADNTHMVVASRLRSALEYQISRLSVFFTDHIGIEPLLRSSVSYAALHSLVQISIDHRPGNKSAAVQSVGSCTSCTWTSCRIYLFCISPVRILTDGCGFAAPEISHLSNQRICCCDHIYTFL